MAISAPKVLIIDDSATLCIMMARILQRAGFQVVIASNGTEGMNKALHERPNCVILDVVLPGGVSGFGVCRQLRALDPHHTLSIIMVSTKSTRVDQNWGLRQGADRYLAKPFTEAELVKTVKEVLAERAWR